MPVHTRALRLLKTSSSGLALLAGLSLVACGRADDGRTRASVAEQQPVTAKETRHRHHHGPVGMVVGVALQHADVSEAQRVTLLHLRDSVRLDRAERHALRQDWKRTVVQIVRSGDAESEQFAEAVRRAAQMAEERLQRSGEALAEVHNTLTPAQRRAVGLVFRDRINERFGADEGPSHQDQRHEAFSRFAKHLALSTLQVAQLDQLHDMLRDEMRAEGVRPTREELTVLVDAFEGDDFASAINDFHAAKLAAVRDRLRRAGNHTHWALSIFDEGQRLLLADLIDRGPRRVLFGESGEASTAEQ